MVALARCLSLASLCTMGVQGARIARKRPSDGQAPSTKFIAGVPVLNYHAAYEGEPSLSELESQHVQTEREGEWIVMVKPETTDSQIQHMCKANRNACKLTGNPSKGGVPFFEMRGSERDLEAVIHSVPGVVKYVEPDQTIRMIPEIEAEVEAVTWGLNRIGADQRGRAGQGATVFILDTGIRVSHNEFGGRAASALDMSSGEGVECNGDVNCAADRDGHGTHCAGTAAGEYHGVAPSASVRAIKVLSDQGSGSWSWSYYALNWLATADIRPAVASMSLGGSGNQQGMVDAVDAAVYGGVTVVVAGGNENSNACSFSPAFVPSAITVGSTTSRDERSPFSNYGHCTNIWAPGSNIKSASHRSDTGFETFSGTSMACPHVAGASALLLGSDPSKKSSAVLSALLGDATRNAITGLRSGDTNALLYVGAGGAPPAPVPAYCEKRTASGPDSDGDCTCKFGLYCHEGGSRGCTFSSTGSDGWTSEQYYLATCANCACK